MQKKCYCLSVSAPAFPDGAAGDQAFTSSVVGGPSEFLKQNRGIRAKILRVMKLTVFLLTVLFVHAYASGSAQTVTISGRNLALKQVFSIIEKQTGFVVFSDGRAITETAPVSLSVR